MELSILQWQNEIFLAGIRTKHSMRRGSKHMYLHIEKKNIHKNWMMIQLGICYQKKSVVNYRNSWKHFVNLIHFWLIAISSVENNLSSWKHPRSKWKSIRRNVKLTIAEDHLKGIFHRRNGRFIRFTWLLCITWLIA